MLEAEDLDVVGVAIGLSHRPGFALGAESQFPLVSLENNLVPHLGQLKLAGDFWKRPSLDFLT